MSKRRNSVRQPSRHGRCGLAVIIATSLAAALFVPTNSGCGRLGCSGGNGYDATPFLASIRPSLRDGFAERAGLQSLSELPLYEIEIDLDLTVLTFRGTQELLIPIRDESPLEDLVFRLYPNARQLNVGGTRNLVVRNVTVDGREVVSEEINATSLRVVLPEPVQNGDLLRVRMEVEGSIPRYRNASGGLLEQGLSQLLELFSGAEARGADYGVYGFGSGILSMGLWYPRLADRNAGGWDSSDPAEVGDVSTIGLANYRVSVTTASDTSVFATGIQSADEALDDRRRRTFLAAAVRSFAMQASREFAVQERQMGEVLVRSIHSRDHLLQGARVADSAAAVLQVYERRFGLYPYSELDVVEAPLRGGAGGVEWPGLVTISRALYEAPSSLGLLGPVQSDGPSQEYWDEMLEFVVAHEIAHQYWNAVVGSDSRNHPFIDEATAQFSAGVYFGDRYGAERGTAVMDRQVRLNYHFHRLVGGADGAVDRPVDRFGNVVEYAGIVYGKGPYYFDALRSQLGEEAFWRGMRTYYDRFAFQVAGPGDFPLVMTEASSNGVVVQSLTQRWLYGSFGDEDLGRAEWATMLEPILGPTASRFLRQIEGLLQGLPGFGGGQGSGGGGQDPGQVINDLLRDLTGGDLNDLLEQVLPGFGGGGGPNPLPPPSQPPAPVPSQPPAPQPPAPFPDVIRKGRPVPPGAIPQPAPPPQPSAPSGPI